MSADALLGQPLDRARLMLGEQLLGVEFTGCYKQPAANNESELRVVRVKQSPTGFRLTVALPPQLARS